MTPGQLSDFFRQLQGTVEEDEFWSDYLKFPVVPNGHRPSIHLGVFVEPYLQFVLEGQKTVESRFSSVRCPPYGRVQEGDVLLLKRSGGPIVGVCRVLHAWFYELDPDSWRDIRLQYTQALCAQDPQFWTQRQKASYATLMRVGNVFSFMPISFPKRDRRGWVILPPLDGLHVLDNAASTRVESVS